VRLFIVDDEAMARRLARRVSSAIDAVDIEGEAECGEDALERFGERGPDVVLMDWSMPGIDGVEATARVLEHHPHARVVGWTSSGDPRLHAAFRKAGAVAVLLKSDVAGLRRFLRRLSESPKRRDAMTHR
jgi:two-component system, NarL family, invasion response regulator UvrY